MKWGLDTSVVVRLLFGDPPESAEAAREALSQLKAKGDIACVDDLVIAEAYYALTHHYHVPKTDALAALKRFLDSGDVIPTGVTEDILQIRNLGSSKPGFVDRVIHASYRRQNASLITLERASAKLAGAKVIRSS